MAAVVAYPTYALGTPATSLGRLELLAALVALGVAVYAAALHVLGVAKLKDIAAALHTQRLRALRRAPSAWHGSPRNCKG